MVINEYMAKTHWPGEDAIGKRITMDDSTWVTIVGITKNTVRSSWAAPASEEFFFPFYQSRYFTDDASHYSSFTLVARASCRAQARCDASALAMPIVSQIRAIDRNIPISVVETMSSAVAGATAESRFYLVLLATFAAIALTLAAVGIYGVISYSVSRRTHEIGIRIALGAQPSTVRWFIVRQGMSLSIIGGRDGPGRRVRDNAPHVQAVVWRRAGRSGHVCGGDRRAVRCGPVGELSPGETCDADRSFVCAAVGLAAGDYEL